MRIKVIIFGALVSTLFCRSLNAQKINEFTYPEMYLQYIPAASGVLLPLLVESPVSTLGERLEVAAVGAISNVIIVQGFKHTIREQRPDGNAYNSFPSGHTATAFYGAELTRRYLGGWWGAGAYALATGVAALRVYHDRHWWWDTLAGAGIGIASASIGYASVRAIRTKCGKKIDVSLVPLYEPYQRATGASLAVSF